MALSREQRALRGRMGAFAQQARHDPRGYTQAARDAWRQRFIAQVDPDLTLPEQERERRVEAAIRAHMTKLAYASSKARSKSPEMKLTPGVPTEGQPTTSVFDKEQPNGSA